MSKQTQGRKLITLLKRRGMTTMELLQTGISTCPWKRINEQLANNEKLLISKKFTFEAGKEINVYRVVTEVK